jgi:hypothetical protein
VAEKNERYLSSLRGRLMQWTGLLAGPLAWGLHMQANLSLVPWVCKHGGEIYIHLVTILALVITAAGAYAAWRIWQEGGEEKANGGGDILSRARFMGALGLMTSAMFFLVIIAQEIPGFFFQPCQR